MNKNPEIEIIVLPDENEQYTEDIPQDNNPYRTLKEAIAYDYDFKISDVMSDAWSMVSGTKLPIFIAVVLAALLSSIVSIIGEWISNIASVIWGLDIIIDIITSAASSIFTVGVIIVALKLANKQPVHAASDFYRFSNYWKPIFILSLLMLIIIMFGFIAFILPGIYFAVAYSLAYWIIIIYPKASAWEILEASRKIVSRHWFKFFLLALLTGFLLAVSILTLGIALIWTIPLCNFMYAIIFKQIFEK